MKALPWALVALVAVLALGQARCAGEREGALQQRVKARETVIAALAKQKARVDTQYLAGKTVYAEAVGSWDSLKLTLGERVKIDPVVIAGDKAIAACGTLIALCEERSRTADSIIAVQTFQIEDLRKHRGGTFLGIPLPSRLTMLGVGVLGGYLLAK